MAIIFRQLGSKLLFLGNWGALFLCDYFLTCVCFFFLASGSGVPPDLPLYISILPLQSILVAKNGLRLASKLANAGITAFLI